MIMSVLYGTGGSQDSRRFDHRATDLKNGNAGPKLHWRLWEKSGFSVVLSDWVISPKNDDPHGLLGTETKLFLAYCLYIRPIFTE